MIGGEAGPAAMPAPGAPPMGTGVDPMPMPVTDAMPMPAADGILAKTVACNGKAAGTDCTFVPKKGPQMGTTMYGTCGTDGDCAADAGPEGPPPMGTGAREAPPTSTSTSTPFPETPPTSTSTSTPF